MAGPKQQDHRLLREQQVWQKFRGRHYLRLLLEGSCPKEQRAHLRDDRAEVVSEEPAEDAVGQHPAPPL